MALTPTAQPAALQAAHNPVPLTVRDTAPAAGTSYYLQVYVTNSRDVVPAPAKAGRLVATPIRPAIGTDATFDLSGILQAELDLPAPPAANGRDTSAYIGYYCKYGTVTYNTAGAQVLTQAGETEVAWALRAALPLSGSGSLANAYGSVASVDAGTTPYLALLTNRPAVTEVDRASTVWLPVFFCREDDPAIPAQKLYVVSLLTFTDGTTQTVTGTKVNAPTGGLYLLDASPAALVPDAAERNGLLRFDARVYASLEDAASGIPLSVTRTFTLRPAPLAVPVQVRFLNRRGGWDALSFTRSREGQLKTKPVLYSTVSGERVLRYDADSEETLFTPWLPVSHEPWLRDLLLSPYVAVEGAYVKLKGHTLNRNNDDEIVSLALTYAPEYDENALGL